MESKIKTNRIKLKQTHRYREQTGGHQKEAELGAKRVKGVNCMMTDGDYTFGGDHFVVYTDDTVKCCIPETDIMYQLYLN